MPKNRFLVVWFCGCMLLDLSGTSYALTFNEMWSWKTSHSTNAPILPSSNNDINSSDTTSSVPINLIVEEGYNDVINDVSLTVDDPKISSIIIPENITVNEGQSTTFEISLSARPLESVAIVISGHADTDITLDKSTLSFSNSNWDTAQSIKVMATKDDDMTNDHVTLRLSTSRGGFIYDDKNLKITIIDDRVAKTQNTAQYDLTFNATWAKATHPTNFPSNAHFSWLVGGTHNSSVSFWNPGSTASDGIKSMAETGGTGTLIREINAAKNQGNAFNTIPLGRVFGSPGTDKVTFTIDSRWSLVTVTSMIAPSPDWFVGVSGLNLMGSDGNWKAKEEVELFAYDAGTDSGTSYNSANQATNPRQNISRIGGVPFLVNGSVRSVGTFVFELKVTNAIDLSASSLTIEEGGSGTFGVSLSKAPSGTVTVTITGNNGDVTVDTFKDTDGDQNTLTFTTSNWNVAKTVTVRAAEDDDDIGDDTAELTLSASGGGYNSVTKTITINVNDNDTGALNAPATVAVAEGGDGTFDISLSVAPSATVTVSISGHANTDVTLSKSRFEFTTSNWNMAQSVTVSAGEDDDDIANDIVDLTLSASGGGYNSVTKDITVNITDNDTGALMVNPTSLTVSEGASATLSVSLSAEPSATVTISVTGHANTDVTLSTSSLEFTTSNWSTVQPVTVNAAKDDDIGEDSVDLLLSASGGGYNNVSQNVAISITDRDQAGLSVPTTVNITEGETATFQVSLTARPIGPVQVSISGHAGTQLTLNPESFMVAPSSYSSETTISISAGRDDNQANETETLTIIANGGGYTNVTESVSVIVNDSDTANLVITPSTVDVNEGENATFSVALMVAPSGNVTVTIPSFANSDLSRSPETLLFTTTNYSDPQDVTISADQDNNALSETETISLTAQGGGYDNVSQSVRINTVDDDLPNARLVVTPNPVSVNEGGDAMFKITLSEAPSDDVTVSLGDITNSMLDFSTSTSLSFSPSNFDDAQGISFSAGEDNNIVDETETITLTANGGGFDNASVQITIRITDNDIPNISLDPSFLGFTEGGSADFDVSLMVLPTGDVTISVAEFTNSDLDLSVSSLTFTTNNYNIPQSVTVTSVDDTDASDDDTESITLTASGGGYDGVTQELVVSVSDDEIEGASIEVSPNSITMNEGSEASLAISLSTAPSSDVTLMISPFQSKSLSLKPSGPIVFTSSNYNLLQTITIVASGDTDIDDETEQIILATSGGGYDHTSTTLTVTVMDTGVTKPSVSLSVAPNPVVEGESLTLEVAISPVITDSSITIPLVYENDTAEAQDYKAVSSITIPANQSRASALLMTNKDGDIDNENFRIGLGQLPSVIMATTTDSITVVIQDSDVASALVFFIQSISESPVDVYLNEEMFIDDFSLLQTATREVRGGTKSLDVVSGDAEDLSSPILSEIINLNTDSTYQILLRKGQDDQSSILLMRQVDRSVHSDSVKVRVVHNAPNLGEVDVTVHDPANDQALVSKFGMNMNYGDVSASVLFKRNLYNLYVTQSMTNIDIEVYAIDWSNSSGKQASSNLGLLILNETFTDGNFTVLGAWHNGDTFSPAVVTSNEDHPMDDQMPVITIGNYPNPFTHRTNLWFTIPQGTDVHVEVIDILGRISHSEKSGMTKNGDTYLHEFDTSTWSPGVYFYRVTFTTETNQTISTGKMIKIR